MLIVAEIARAFGNDATPSSIHNVYKRQLGPAVKRVQAALANGEDPQYLQPWGLCGLQGSNGSGFFQFLHFCTNFFFSWVRLISFMDVWI